MNVVSECSHLSVIETRFSASEYMHVSPTSTQAAQGSGGFPAQRVFRERHRLHLSKEFSWHSTPFPMRTWSRLFDSRDCGSPVGAVLRPSNDTFATDHCRASGCELKLISWQVDDYQGILFLEWSSFAYRSPPQFGSYQPPGYWAILSFHRSDVNFAPPPPVS
jgi:hypothetical protein